MNQTKENSAYWKVQEEVLAMVKELKVISTIKLFFVIK